MFARGQPEEVHQRTRLIEPAHVARLGHQRHRCQHLHAAERKAFLIAQGVLELRFWNSQLRRNAQSIRDTIYRELQAREPHPLPDYTQAKPGGSV
jgi:very-short-patch-repair endonuclease